MTKQVSIVFAKNMIHFHGFLKQYTNDHISELVKARRLKVHFNLMCRRNEPDTRKVKTMRAFMICTPAVPSLRGFLQLFAKLRDLLALQKSTQREPHRVATIPGTNCIK